jgi:transposase for insertion sequence element
MEFITQIVNVLKILVMAEGYYVSTVGLNESTIRKYIREQESHDIAMDKLITKEYTNPFVNNK